MGRRKGFWINVNLVGTDEFQKLVDLLQEIYETTTDSDTRHLVLTHLRSFKKK